MIERNQPADHVNMTTPFSGPMPVISIQLTISSISNNDNLQICKTMDTDMWRSNEKRHDNRPELQLRRNNYYVFKNFLFVYQFTMQVFFIEYLEMFYKTNEIGNYTSAL